MPEHQPLQSSAFVKLPKRRSQCQVLIQRADVVRNEQLSVRAGFLQSSHQFGDQNTEFSRGPALVQLHLYRLNLRMTGVYLGYPDKLDPLIELTSTPGQDAHRMPGLRHNPRVVGDDAFDTAYNRRASIVQDVYIHNSSTFFFFFSRLDRQVDK